MTTKDKNTNSLTSISRKPQLPLDFSELSIPTISVIVRIGLFKLRHRRDSSPKRGFFLARFLDLYMPTNADMMPVLHTNNQFTPLSDHVII